MILYNILYKSRYAKSITLKNSLVILILLLSIFIADELEMYDVTEALERVAQGMNQEQQSNENDVNEFSIEEEILQKPLTLVNISEYSFYFCNRDNFPCYNSYFEAFENAQNSIQCAIQDFNQDNLTQVLYEQSAKGVAIQLVVDSNYIDRDFITQLENTSVEIIDDSKRDSRYDNLMHHKFCIIDEKDVIFGSANPTGFGLQRNENIVLKVNNSPELAEEFLSEFDMLFNNTFGTNKDNYDFYNTKYQLIENDEIIGEFKVYFCPHQNCNTQTTQVLESATKSIEFLTFVLTYDEIEEILKNKSREGVEVRGLVESRLINARGSIISDELQYLFDIKKEDAAPTMHHKTFIIDNQSVIFGSLNPSNSGMLYNDESVIILNSSKISQQFNEEFERLYKEGIYFRENQTN